MSNSKKNRHYKKVPKYWWDFGWNQGEIHAIVIESNHKDFPLVAEIIISGEDAMPEIDQAEKLIADLKAGRKDPRELLKQLSEKQIRKYFPNYTPEN